MNIADHLATIERRTGVPLRFSLPAALTCLCVLAGATGAVWDVSYHVVAGATDRALITAPHMLVLVGIHGVFVAVLLHALLPGPRVPGERRVLGGRGSLAPGGILVLVCAVAGFMAFGLDDFWHRKLGTDPTVWGPTHVVMIVSSAFATIGAWSLMRQGQLIGRPSRTSRRLQVWIAGTLLVSLAVIQTEFDLGSPSFRLLYHPVVLAFTAGLAMVCARSLLGPGGAIKALAVFLVFRGALAVAVGPVLGEATPHFPLYIAEALVVEAAGLLAARSPLRFAVASGIGIGTVGTAAGYAWSHVWMIYPWPASLLAEGLPLALAAGVGGALLGLRIAHAIGQPQGSRAVPVALPPRTTIAAGVLLLVALLPLLPRTDPDGTSASYVATAAGNDRARVTVTLHPPDAARGAEWFTLSSFGGNRRETFDLHEVSTGRYQPADAVPLAEGLRWEVRLAQGSSLMMAPLSLVTPQAIRSAAPAAPAVSDTVRFARDTPGGLGNGDLTTVVAYAMVIALALAWLLLMVRGLRLAESSSAGLASWRPGQPRPSEAAPVTAPG